MNVSPQNGGGQPTIASVIFTVAVVAIMLAMVAAGGGVLRPLTSHTTVVASTPGHARQG